MLNIYLKYICLKPLIKFSYVNYICPPLIVDRQIISAKKTC